MRKHLRGTISNLLVFTLLVGIMLPGISVFAATPGPITGDPTATELGYVGVRNATSSNLNAMTPTFDANDVLTFSGTANANPMQTGQERYNLAGLKLDVDSSSNDVISVSADVKVARMPSGSNASGAGVIIRDANYSTNTTTANTLSRYAAAWIGTASSTYRMYTSYRTNENTSAVLGNVTASPAWILNDVAKVKVTYIPKTGVVESSVQLSGSTDARTSTVTSLAAGVTSVYIGPWAGGDISAEFRNIEIKVGDSVVYKTENAVEEPTGPTLNKSSADFDGASDVPVTVTLNGATLSKITDADGNNLKDIFSAVSITSSGGSSVVNFLAGYLNKYKGNTTAVFNLYFSGIDDPLTFSVTIPSPSLSSVAAVFEGSDIRVTMKPAGYSLDKITVKGNTIDIQNDSTKITKSGNQISFLASGYLDSMSGVTIYALTFSKAISTGTDTVSVEFTISVPNTSAVKIGANGYSSMSDFEGANPMFASHTLTKEEYDAGLKYVGTSSAQEDTTKGVTPKENLAPWYYSTGGALGIVDVVKSYSEIFRASTWNNNAGNGHPAYSFNHVRGNGISLDKWSAPGNASAMSSLISWGTSSGDMPAVGTSKNVGMALNMGENTQFDTVVVYGGLYASEKIVPFTSDCVSQVSVDTATASTKDVTWDRLPTGINAAGTQVSSNGNPAWSGSNMGLATEISDIDGGRWVLLGEPKVINNDGTCVFVFRSAVPVTAQFVRCSISLTGGGRNGTGLTDGSQVYVNSFEVYNSQAMGGTEYPSISEQEGLFITTNPTEISTTIISDGSEFSGIDAPAALTGFTQGNAYSIDENKKITFNADYMLNCPDGIYPLKVKFSDGKELAFRLTVVIPQPVTLSVYDLTYDTTQRNRVSVLATVPYYNGITGISTAENSLSNANYVMSNLDTDRKTTIEFQPHYLESLAVGTYTYTVNTIAGGDKTFTLTVTNTVPGGNTNPGYGWYTKGTDRNVDVELRTAGGVTLTAVSNGSSVLQAGSWSVSGGRFIINSNYLENLSVNRYNLTLTFSNGDTKPFMLGVAEKSLIDYSVWQLQDPTFASNAPWDVAYSRDNLVNRNFSSWWYGGTGSAGTTSLAGYDIFQTSLAGYGTSGSGYIRCELREVLPNTNEPANWNPRGYNIMETDESVIMVNKGTSGNNGASKTCIGQIWSTSSGMFELFVNNSSVFTFHPTNDGTNIKSFSGNGFDGAELINGSNVWSSGLAVGTPFRVRYELINLQIKVYFKTESLNGGDWFEIYEETVNSTRAFYFKAGNYDQTATNVGTTQWVADSSVPHSLIGIRDIQILHNPVAGTLVDANGAPLAGQTVSYSIPVYGATGITVTGTVTTDENGRYLIPNVPFQAGSQSSTNDRISPVSISFPLTINGNVPSTRTYDVPARYSALDVLTVNPVSYGLATSGGGGGNTNAPSPTTAPTTAPTIAPTTEPTAGPSTTPTSRPISEPTTAPTTAPGKTPIPTPVPQPAPEVKTVDVTPAIDTVTGKVTLIISDTAEIESAIDGLKDKKGAGIVEISIQDVETIKDLVVQIPSNVIGKLVDETDASLKISAGTSMVTFDNFALQKLHGESNGGGVKIEVTEVNSSTLPATAQNVIGDRPVYNFEVTAGTEKVTDFGIGKATCAIPYTLRPDEDPNAVVVYFIDSQGNLQGVRCKYNEANGYIEFMTNHFSKYGVGYNFKGFIDVVQDQWYYDAITFAAARGITTGTGNDRFSPNKELTRGEFIVMLMRAYNIAPDAADSQNNFNDVKSTDFYAGYTAAAKRLGITAGTGNGNFDANMKVSREMMFQLLYNVLAAINELPGVLSGPSIDLFDDADNIESYYLTGMTLLVRCGVVGGTSSTENLLSPKSNATRATMAQVLYNLLGK